jgi:hypothetical protein
VSRQRVIGIVTVAVSAAALVAGCSSSSKSSTSPTTTTLAVDTKGFQVQAPEGQVSLSLDGVLPPNWPAGFPVAPNTEAAGSGSLGGTAQTNLVGVYSSTDAPEDVYRFYASTDAYKIDSSSSIGAGSVFIGTVRFSGAYEGSASIVSRSGKVYVVVVLHQAGPASTTTTTAGT